MVVIAVLSALTLAGCKTTESNYRESYEAAVRKTRVADTVASLTQKLLAANASGSLAQRVREVVEENRALAR